MASESTTSELFPRPWRELKICDYVEKKIRTLGKNPGCSRVRNHSFITATLSIFFYLSVDGCLVFTEYNTKLVNCSPAKKFNLQDWSQTKLLIYHKGTVFLQFLPQELYNDLFPTPLLSYLPVEKAKNKVLSVLFLSVHYRWFRLVFLSLIHFSLWYYSRKQFQDSFQVWFWV